jgi:hypothetical protein
MTFAARLRHNTAVTIGVAAVVLGVYAVYDVTLHRADFLSGWLLFATLLVLTLLNLRKKVTVLPIGSAAAWLQVHVYAGWLSVVLFLLHVGWRWPDGPLETTLGALYVVVTGSGFVGLALSRMLSKRLTRRGEEVIYERIPIFAAQLREEAENVVLQSAEQTDSSTVADFYHAHLSAFFSAPKNFLQHLMASNRGLFALLAEIADMERYLSPEERVFVERLRELVQRKDELDFHHALQTTLKSWLFVHVPIAYSLLILAVLHLVLVYAFSGGP